MIDIEKAINTTTVGDSPQMARMREARMDLQLKNPYLGMLACRLRLEQAMAPKGVFTVSVHDERILFTRSFVDSFKTDQALLDFLESLMAVAEAGDEVFSDAIKRTCAEATGR